MFDGLNPGVLYNVLGWAVSTWYDRRKDITKLRKRGMMQDFSWHRSAEKYMELYKKIFKNS